MAKFDIAIDYVLRNEGFSPATGATGWIDDPDDLGGVTNYGITLTTARRYGIETRDQLRDMTLTQVKEIYKAEFWRPHMDQIRSQRVATKLLDIFTHFGPYNGVKIAQDAVNLAVTSMKVDGILGPLTVMAINGIDENKYLALLTVVLGYEYATRIVKRPNQEKWRRGWLSRAARYPV